MVICLSSVACPNCQQQFLWCDKINITVRKNNTSHSIGNLHTESLGAKISSEQKVACENVIGNENLLCISKLAIFNFSMQFVSNWWRSKWNENKHFAATKLKWLFSPVVIGKMRDTLLTLPQWSCYNAITHSCTSLPSLELMIYFNCIWQIRFNQPSKHSVCNISNDIQC